MARLVNSSDFKCTYRYKIERQEEAMKKYHRASLLFFGFMAIFIMQLNPITTYAWGDNYTNPETGEKGRPSYTMEEINEGAIGATSRSDGEDYKNSPSYPGQIIFNTISDSPVGDEKNYVAAKECVQREDGSWENDNKEVIWTGNDITVEDGKYYIIRLYVHNNNPNGKDAVAEDAYVSFSIPNEYDKENRRIQVNGFIESSNAVPSEYWDYVNFNSDVPFCLSYIYGSALLYNNGIGLDGLNLSDDIVLAKSGGTMIGYDALDGRIPGGYYYSNYVTVKVRAIFDYEYTVEQKVRLAGSDHAWGDTIKAKIGDKVEFRIEYKNTSDLRQTNVVVKNILPKNLRYVEGSSKIINSTYARGEYISNDALVDSGIQIGNYAAGENAYIYFIAEVIDDNLATGLNPLTNWSQAGVGLKTMQDYATVEVSKGFKFTVTSKVLLVLILFCLIGIVVLGIRMWQQKYRHIE